MFRVIWSYFFFLKIKSLSISLNVWDWWWSQSQFLRPKTKVSVSVSIFETIFIKSQSQSQNLIPILKVSVSVSKIETGYTESQSQSQHAKTGLAHPWWIIKIVFITFEAKTFLWLETEELWCKEIILQNQTKAFWNLCNKVEEKLSKELSLKRRGEIWLFGVWASISVYQNNVFVF